jgi:hypothetical protein
MKSSIPVRQKWGAPGRVRDPALGAAAFAVHEEARLVRVTARA